jgi:hypothetical protein
MLFWTRLCLLFVAVTAGCLAAPPAGAQCRLCDQPITERISDGQKGDVQLRIEANLNFDRLILLGAGSGVATIRPDGSRGSEGSVAEMGPRAMVGTVLVHGEPGLSVEIELPRRITLYSLSGGSITLDDVASDAKGAPRLDAAGNLSFRFGGRLIVSGDTDGQYRGDLPITVEYADSSDPMESLTGH